MIANAQNHFWIETSKIKYQPTVDACGPKTELFKHIQIHCYPSPAHNNAAQIFIRHDSILN